MVRNGLLYFVIFCVGINLTSCLSTRKAMDFKSGSYNRLIASQELIRNNLIQEKKGKELPVAIKPGSEHCFSNTNTESRKNTSVIESNINRNNTLLRSKVKPSFSFQKLAFAISDFSKSSNKITNDCDTIIFNNGSKHYGKVMKVERNQIDYQNCNEPNGPVHSFPRSNIKEIKYSNGYIEIINENKSINHSKSYRFMNLGGLWISLLILSVALFSIAGTIGTFSIGGVILILLCILTGVAFVVYYVCWLLKIMQIIKAE